VHLDPSGRALQCLCPSAPFSLEEEVGLCSTAAFGHVLFHMQNRKFGSYLGTMNRTLISDGSLCPTTSLVLPFDVCCGSDPCRALPYIDAGCSSSGVRCFLHGGADLVWDDALQLFIAWFCTPNV
jgi:hypothetical protein